MIPQPARGSRSLGAGARAVEFRCFVDGDEWGFQTGDRRGRNPDSSGDSAVRQAQSGAGVMLRAGRDGVTLAVRAQPGAKKTAIVGAYGEGSTAQLKIAIHAPPVEGRATAALIAFLAEIFSLPRNSVEVVSGELSRSKVFLLRSLSIDRAEALLASAQVKGGGPRGDD